VNTIDLNIKAAEYLKIMEKSKTNFFYSSVFLSKEKSEALRIVYAYCRFTDDIVDDENLSPEDKMVKLNLWKSELENTLYNNYQNEFFLILKNTIDKYKIPHKPFFDLIKGMEMDLVKKEYKTFDDLYEYCLCAASSVGLMTIEIFGYKNENIKKYAEYLGIALQLTNILRDIKKDTELGRIYLPLEDLNKFGYSKTDLLENVYNETFEKLMIFESERANEFYEKANEYISSKDKGNMIAARIMEFIYKDLLKKIKKSNYNVFDNFIRVSKMKKLFIAYCIFIKYKIFYLTS